jgi:hypothetical protein
MTGCECSDNDLFLMYRPRRARVCFVDGLSTARLHSFVRAPPQELSSCDQPSIRRLCPQHHMTPVHTSVNLKTSNAITKQTRRLKLKDSSLSKHEEPASTDVNPTSSPTSTYSDTPVSLTEATASSSSSVPESVPLTTTRPSPSMAPPPPTHPCTHGQRVNITHVSFCSHVVKALHQLLASLHLLLQLSLCDSLELAICGVKVVSSACSGSGDMCCNWNAYIGLDVEVKSQSSYYGETTRIYMGRNIEHNTLNLNMEVMRPGYR